MKEKFKGMLEKLGNKFKNKFQGGKAGSLVGKMTGDGIKEAGKLGSSAKRFGRLVTGMKK